MTTTNNAGASPLRLFIPISKIDLDHRLVFGVATAEQPDRSGEICDYASTKPFYQKWSDNFVKNTGGRSFGNLRSMHQKIAAGKITELNFDDENKQILICAKVVDDAEWEKCVEGVHTGFSQGGRYVERWRDPATKMMRYTADPTEISLVDMPCLPSATFSVIKSAGVEEVRAFKSVIAEPTVGAVMDRAYALAKAAGAENPSDAQISEAKNALIADALAKADGTAVNEPVVVEKSEPTDHDVDRKAYEIAASNGETEVTEDHRAKARAALSEPEPEPIQDIDSDAVRSLDVPAGNPSNGATAMTAEEGVTLKAATAPDDEPVQGFWDGEKFHLKARDARRAIRVRKAAKVISDVTAPVESALDELSRALGIEKKDYSDAERKKMAEQGHALPDGSFPIANVADLKNAIQAFGRAKDPDAAKAHIEARAKALGAESELPDDWHSKTADAAGLTKEDAPSHAERMAQHKAMMAFHANQDGEGHMKAAAAHADAYMAHSAGSADAEDKTKTAFQASRDCIGGACKDAGIGDLLKAAGAGDLVKDAAMVPADKAGVHAAMANFHAKMAAEEPANQDAHRAAAGAHAAAHIAQSTGADDADAKSDDAFKCTMKCMGPQKSLEAFALFGARIAKADQETAATGLRKGRSGVFARLGKGLPTCARLANLIEDLQWVLKAVYMEAKQENDNSPLPMKLKADLTSLCETLNAMVAEETKELIAGHNIDDLYAAGDVMADQGVYAAARVAGLIKFIGADADLVKAGEALQRASELESSIAVLKAAVEGRAILAKAGRRNSAGDMARIQKVHDLATDLGADCGGATGKAAHASGSEAMEKLESLQTENATLKASMADYGTRLSSVLVEVEKLKASPVPAKAALFAVSKDGEVARATGSSAGPSQEEFAKAWAVMTPEQRADFEMRKSLANPVRHIPA